MENKLRLRFLKEGKAKYISHLDLMETMKRAFLRAGIKLKYSQGFNPHPNISIALPLSVGCASLAELIDFKTEDYLLPDGLPDLLNNVLPDGIRVYEAYIPFVKFNLIKWVLIKAVLYYKETPQNIAKNLMNRFSVDCITVSKKTKRGITDINLKQHFRDIKFNVDEAVTMSVLLSAQEPSINPQNLMSALSGEYKYLAPDFAAFTRIEIYNKDLNVFR